MLEYTPMAGTSPLLGPAPLTIWSLLGTDNTFHCQTHTDTPELLILFHPLEPLLKSKYERDSKVCGQQMTDGAGLTNQVAASQTMQTLANVRQNLER